MRKITLLIASFLLTIGAMAQPQVGKYYKIKGNHSTNPWLTAFAEGGAIDVASNEANAGIYQITENGIRELFTGKYIGTTGSQITLVSNANETIIESSDNGRYLIKNNGRYLYNNKSDFTREAGNLTAADTDDPKWYFIEVTPLFTIDNTFNGRGTLCYGNWTDGNEYLALTNVTLDGYVTKSVEVKKDANKYWYVTRTNNGLHIYNIGKGVFLQTCTAEKVSCSASIANGFTTEIRSKNDIYYRSIKSDNCYLTYSCAYDPNDNVGQVRWINNNEEAATLLSFNEVKDAATYYAAEIATANDIINDGRTLEVTDAGWATLYLGYNALIPDFTNAGDDAGVYIVEGVKYGGWLALKNVNGVLPANTGVIVKANKGSYVFKYSIAETTDVAGNLLRGSVVDTQVNAAAWALGYSVEEPTEVVFAPVVMNDGTWKNNAYKAYLPNETGAAMSNSLRFDFGTTAIEEVETENAEVEVIYDLCGRRVNEITKAGVYIINGKKVLVK